MAGSGFVIESQPYNCVNVDRTHAQSDTIMHVPVYEGYYCHTNQICLLDTVGGICTVLDLYNIATCEQFKRMNVCVHLNYINTIL